MPENVQNENNEQPTAQVQQPEITVESSLLKGFEDDVKEIDFAKVEEVSDFFVKETGREFQKGSDFKKFTDDYNRLRQKESESERLEAEIKKYEQLFDVIPDELYLP
ncbi:MAG: hypothetical protein PHH82_04935, partial [Candidatus ainarchaeum sp.]|nr:hypothetical protein [Candidatus ainarchaeum sp.]